MISLSGTCLAIVWLGASVSAAAAAEAPAQAPVAENESAAPARGSPDITFDDSDDEGRPGASEKGTSPFQQESTVLRRDAVPGTIELSDGRKIPGTISTTRAKRLKIYNLERSVYEYVPVPALTEIEAVVEWERMEDEWRFKEAGNPEKVYSGKAYPARMLAWKLTLRNGHQITGHILGQPLYVTREGAAERWILHERDKGPIGSALEDLVYIRRVVFGKKAYTQAVKEMKAREAAAPGASDVQPSGPPASEPTP